MTLHRTPIPAAEVLLFGPGERPAPLVAIGVTDAAGAYALTPGPDTTGSLTVLAKLKGSVVGVAAWELPRPPAGAALLDVEGPVWAVTVTMQSDAGYPDELTLAFEPDAPARVPRRLWPFVAQRAPGVFDVRFATRPLTGRAGAVSLLSGTWRLAGERIDGNRPNIVAPTSANYVVAAAHDESGAPLPGTESRGFALEVDRDRRVTLVLREVADAELG